MQTKRQSAVEAVVNTLTGYGVSLGVSLVIYPLFGFPVTFVQANALTCIFTALSILRNYIVRRLFN